MLATLAVALAGGLPPAPAPVPALLVETGFCILSGNRMGEGVRGRQGRRG